MSRAGWNGERLLTLGRRGLSPEPRDADRVRQALEQALARGDLGHESSPKPVRAQPVRPTLPARLFKWAQMLAFGAATGVSGYVLGVQQAATPVTHGAAIAPVASRTLTAPSLPDVAPSAVSVPEAAKRAPRTAGVAATAAAPTSRESSLELETRLLSRVERALRDDNPRLALGLLDELDQQVPRGQLLEERQAGRVVAECALGTAAAAGRAADFIERHRNSAYRARIEQACAPSR